MLRRDAFREYLRGSLWVLPTFSVAAAITLGSILSKINVSPDSLLAFQGTPDDARNLLIGITSTMVTVIALLLGLAVVALQLSSTQFSPRLLRNFLRDRPNQIVLGVFVGTFAYSGAGLFTVGVSRGNRTADFPRLAVSVAIALLFVSLALLVFFADHLAHSIQVDAIMRVVERSTLPVVRAGMFTSEDPPPEPPANAVVIVSLESGYVQAVNVDRLLDAATTQQATVRVRPRVGEHVVAGTILAWAWRDGAVLAPEGAHSIAAAAHGSVRIGFERTLEQDPGFGFRQLVDVACKALSPGINDPYTAIQAVEHLSVLFAGSCEGPVGDHVARDTSGTAMVVIPNRRFAEHLSLGVGLIRRYGKGEPTVIQALVRLLESCATLSAGRPDRWPDIERELDLLVADATQAVAQPADLAMVHTAAERVRVRLR